MGQRNPLKDPGRLVVRLPTQPNVAIAHRGSKNGHEDSRGEQQGSTRAPTMTPRKCTPTLLLHQ
eukprot:1420711-Pyramimonas_sp.AAC.1